MLYIRIVKHGILKFLLTFTFLLSIFSWGLPGFISCSMHQVFLITFYRVLHFTLCLACIMLPHLNICFYLVIYLYPGCIDIGFWLHHTDNILHSYLFVPLSQLLIGSVLSEISNYCFHCLLKIELYVWNIFYWYVFY